MATLVGLPLTWALAGLSLRLPLVIGGGIDLALAAWLVVAMAERHHPTRQAGDTLRGSAATARRHTSDHRQPGARPVRGGHPRRRWRQRGVRPPLGGSPARQRRLPRILVTARVVRPSRRCRRSSASSCGPRGAAAPAATRSQLMRWLVGLTALQVVGLFAFGLASSLLVAASALLVVNQTRRPGRASAPGWSRSPTGPAGHRALGPRAVRLARTGPDRPRLRAARTDGRHPPGDRRQWGGDGAGDRRAPGRRAGGRAHDIGIRAVRFRTVKRSHLDHLDCSIARTLDVVGSGGRCS